MIFLQVRAILFYVRYLHFLHIVVYYSILFERKRMSGRYVRGICKLEKQDISRLSGVGIHLFFSVGTFRC